MPHRIANNLASVVVMLIVLYIVLTIDLLKEWIWEIDIAMWFLILASNTIIVEEELDDILSAISFNFLIYFLVLKEWGWKEKWSENKSIRQFSGLNSSLKKENKEKNLLCLLSISISGNFKSSLCLGIR